MRGDANRGNWVCPSARATHCPSEPWACSPCGVDESTSPLVPSIDSRTRTVVPGSTPCSGPQRRASALVVASACLSWVVESLAGSGAGRELPPVRGGSAAVPLPSQRAGSSTHSRGIEPPLALGLGLGGGAGLGVDAGLDGVGRAL